MKNKFVLFAIGICTIVLLSFLVQLVLPFIVDNVTAQDPRLIIWVFDKDVADSQFGYYDGTIIQSTTPTYKDADIEGLACLNNVIYASGGRDGKAPSTLNTLAIDRISNQSTLTKIADIHTADGAAFFEVVSLSAKADGSLWGYADNPPLRGIIQLDPASGVATLIVPFDHKVEGIAWIDNTLWLAGYNHLYRWAPGGNITLAFDVAGVGQIEALEPIDGLLYAGVNNDARGVIALDPSTGTIVKGKGFLAPSDIEGLTFCPLQLEILPTPTATNTPTMTATMTPLPTASATQTATVTSIATSTSTPLPTASATQTVTVISTATPVSTLTPVPGLTEIATPTSSTPAPQLTEIAPPTGLDPVDEPTPLPSVIYLPFVTH